jgi:hypothetical protein
VRQRLAGGTTIGVLLGIVDKILLAEPAIRPVIEASKIAKVCLSRTGVVRAARLLPKLKG